MVSKYPELERGESASKTGPRVFKQAANLNKQATRIFALLQDTNPFNAKKNAAELDRLLRKFFPEMGKFATKLKQYDQTIKGLERSKKDLADENAALEQELKEAATVKTNQKFEEALLKADLFNLQRVMDAIPPEIIFRYTGKKPNQERGG